MATSPGLKQEIMEFSTAFRGKKVPIPSSKYPLENIPSINRRLPMFESLLSRFGFYHYKTDILEEGVYLNNFLSVEKSEEYNLDAQFTFIPTHEYFDWERFVIEFSIDTTGNIYFQHFFQDYLERKRKMKHISEKEIYYHMKMVDMIMYADDHGINLYSEFYNYYNVLNRDRIIDEVLQ